MTAPVSPLLKLKEWLTLDEAARYLSLLFEQATPVTSSDVLQFVLQRQLTLSVKFLNTVPVRPAQLVQRPLNAFGTITTTFIDVDGTQVIKSLPIDKEGKSNLDFDEFSVFVEGLWDLPMLGEEARVVERLYHALTDGIEVKPRGGGVGILLKSITDDSFAELQLPEALFRPRPAMVLPTDAVPLVRTAALRAFGDALNPSRTIHKTLGTKERQSLLVIIAALADAAKIPLTDAAAATKVSSLVDQLGCRMDVKTIATHLKGIPEALEARKP